MSRFFDGGTAADFIDMAVGNGPPDEGPITVAVLARPSSASFTGWAVQGMTASGVWAILCDSSKLFCEGDFGTGGPAHGTGWCWYVMTKASGSVIPRWHMHDLTAATAWTHTDDSATVGDGSGPITKIRIGSSAAGSTTQTFRGRIAAVATWTSVLSDVAVEAACTLAAADLAAAAPGWGALLNQASTATAVTDFTGGGGDQTALSGTAVDADEPPGWSYSLTSAPPAVGLDVYPWWPGDGPGGAERFFADPRAYSDGASAGGIVNRTATVAETASGTSITGTLPTDRQAGDYVIAQFSMSCTVAQFTGPGGSWTQIVAPTVNGTSEIVAVYAMFSPSSAPTGTSSAVAGRHTCVMQAYGMVDTTTPVDVAAVTTAGTLPVALTGVTTVTVGARLIAGTTADFSTGTWTFPAGMTAVATHTSGTGRGSAYADEVRVTAGPTGTRTFTASTLQAAVGYMLALRPATAGAGSAANAPAETASGTGAAVDAVAALEVNAETSTATGAAVDATVSTATATNAPAETALGIGAGIDASIAETVAAGTAVATGTAVDATADVGVQAATATAAGVAVDATVSTATATNAPAETASATAAAVDAVVALMVTAVTAAATGAAHDATAALGINADAAAATGTAVDATVSTAAQTSAPAETAAATAAAVDASVAITATAGTPTAAAVAVDAAGSAGANAQSATATGTAVSATVTIGKEAPALEAMAVGAAYDATVAITVIAGTAAAVGEAVQAVGQTATAITHRPFTGTTARPSGGTMTRPGAGTTARPGSGVTVRPFTGVTVR